MSLQNLLQACNDKKERRIKELLKNKTIKEQINELVDDKDIQNPGDYIADKTTPLHVASQHATGSIIKFLLESGSKTDIYDSFGYCAIHHACWSKVDSLSKVKVLIDNDIDSVGRRDKKDYTPLAIAAAAGNNEVVVYLLQNGACVNDVDRAGSTALHGASYNGRTNVMTTLLQWNVDANQQNHAGYTALHEAAHQARITAIKLLLSYESCNLFVRDTGGRTALDVAVLKPNRKAADEDYEEVIYYLSYKMCAEMTAKAIRSNLDYLVKHAACTKHVEYLHAHMLLDDAEYKKIKNINDAKHQMRSMLIMLLKRESPDWAPILFSALQANPDTGKAIEEIAKSCKIPQMLREKTMV